MRQQSIYVYFTVFTCILHVVHFKSVPKVGSDEKDLIEQFLLFDMNGRMMRQQIYIPSIDYLHKERTDEVIFSTALNITKCIGTGCNVQRFGWSVRTYAKLEDTHQEDFINMITVNLAQLVYGSPELFGMGIMDEFFRAHSKVDRVLQVNLQPLIVPKELAYQFGLKEFGSYHFKTEE